MANKRNLTLYIDGDIIETFEKKVGTGNISTTLENLMRQFVRFDEKTQTKEEFIAESEEREALETINLDPYNKLKFDYERSKDRNLTAIGFLKKYKR